MRIAIRREAFASVYNKQYNAQVGDGEHFWHLAIMIKTIGVKILVIIGAWQAEK